MWGGGALSETVLWTNPSPNSNWSSSEVNISQSISSFKYIGLYCHFSTSDSTESFAMVKASDLETIDPTIKSVFLTVSVRRTTSGTGQVIARNVFKSNSDSSKITIGSCGAVTSGTGGTYNGNLIPIKLVGLK